MMQGVLSIIMGWVRYYAHYLMLGAIAIALMARLLTLTRAQGRSTQKLEQLYETHQQTVQQLRATHHAPRSRDELVQRLHQGEF